MNYICSDKFNTLKIYNVNTQENKFSRKRMLSFDDLTDYMPKIKAKILDILLTGNNYSKIIENVVEHGVSNNLETVSDSGVPKAYEPKLINIPKTLSYFSLSTNDKIIYSSGYVKKLWVE